MASINTITCLEELTDTQNPYFFPSSSALIPVSTILSLALLYMFTHDKRRRHFKPVFKIKSLYNEKRLPQVPVSFCYCVRNVCETFPSPFLLITYSSLTGIRIEEEYPVFGNSL